MSKTAWTTLGLSCAFTSSLIYLVHRQQRVEKQAMRAGIEAENAKRNAESKTDEETQKRLEKNRADFELQQQLAEQLSSHSSEN